MSTHIFSFGRDSRAYLSTDGAAVVIENRSEWISINRPVGIDDAMWSAAEAALAAAINAPHAAELGTLDGRATRRAASISSDGINEMWESRDRRGFSHLVRGEAADEASVVYRAAFYAAWDSQT